MDVDAVLARHPQVALVDELAHTNVPGSRNEKRWQDVEELLAAGIDVISTVNIQHLESLNDVVEKITGVPQRERVPDAVVRAADQVELVDMAPEALRRRMAHGNVYAAEKVDAALGNYFRVGNLTALRELALLWTADKVDEALQGYREQNGIEEHVGDPRARRGRADRRAGGRDPDPSRGARSPPARPAVTCSPSTSPAPTGSPAPTPPTWPPSDSWSRPSAAPTTRSSATTCRTPCWSSPARRTPPSSCSACSRRSRLAALLTGPGIGADVIRDSGDIDVHLVTHHQMGKGYGLPRPHGSLTRRRRLQGFVLACCSPRCSRWRSCRPGST